MDWYRIDDDMFSCAALFVEGVFNALGLTHVMLKLKYVTIQSLNFSDICLGVNDSCQYFFQVKIWKKVLFVAMSMFTETVDPRGFVSLFIAPLLLLAQRDAKGFGLLRKDFIFYQTWWSG